MKKYLKYIGIFFLLGIFLSPMTFTHAAGGPETPSATVGPVKTVINSIVPGAVVLDYLSDKALSNVFSYVGYTILKIMAWFLWLTGLMLNFVLRYTVVEMAAHINGVAGDASNPGVTGINIAWKVIKDLLNIGFIFLLVWEGLKMIMGMKASPKNLIVGIITASLLINFSLFFTKVIIDASNIATIGFYNSIVPAADQNNSTYGAGLSTAFARVLGISEFYNQASIDNLNKNSGSDTGNILTITILGSILFLVASFVFFAISAMFIVRYITFLILLTLSPIAFFGIAFPGMKKSSSQWWDTLLGQCLFAPVYMIMTWVIITIMSSDKFAFGQGGGSLTNLVTGGAVGKVTDPGSIGLIVNYIIIIGLVIASLSLAKSFANQGSKQIATFTGFLTGTAGSLIIGGAAAVGRGTIGAYANSKANDQDLKDRAAAGDKRAQLQLKAARYASEGSFDLRRSFAGEKIAKTTGVDLGKGSIFNEKAGVGGYKKKVEENADKEKKYAESLKMSPEQLEIAKNEKDRLEKLEEAKRERIFNSPEKKKEIEDRKKADEENVKKAEEEQEKLQQEINSRTQNIDKKVKDLEEKIKNTINAGLKADLQAQLDQEKINQQKVKQEVKVLSDSVNEKIEIIKKGREKIKNIEQDAEAEKKRWMSDEYKQAVKIAGGQDEKKENGRVIQERVQSKNDENLYAYAQTFDRTADFIDSSENDGWLTTRIPRILYGNPQYNRSMATKIRGSIKKKDVKTQLEELLKDQGEIKIPEKPEPPAAGAPTP